VFLLAAASSAAIKAIIALVSLMIEVMWIAGASKSRLDDDVDKTSYGLDPYGELL